MSGHCEYMLIYIYYLCIGQVRKTYSGALESLSCINDSDIFELMSYRKPPEVLFPVFNALCMIFDRQEK